MSLTVTSGRRRRRIDVSTYCSDKKAAEEVERRVRKLAVCAETGEPPTGELRRWID